MYYLDTARKWMNDLGVGSNEEYPVPDYIKVLKKILLPFSINFECFSETGREEAFY